jgi:hypothetical protein
LTRSGFNRNGTIPITAALGGFGVDRHHGKWQR